MDPKVKAIIAHLTIFGWIVAFLINQNDRDSFTTFYLRQTLAIVLAGTLTGMMHRTLFMSGFIGIVIFIFWLISLINCINGKTEEIPIVGHYFQDWFKGI